MPKIKNLNKITTLTLTAVLIISCFTGVLTFASGQAFGFQSQPIGSAAEIAALEATVEAYGGWNSSLQTIYDGIALGQTTVGELQNAVDSINITSTSAAETVFFWYFELSKFGVGINATTIEAALNDTQMLPGVGGLPDDYDNINVSPNIPSFLVYNRYDLYAYQWATQLSYETSKWNLTMAYTVFNNGVTNNSVGYSEPVLCVGSNGQGWGIGYGPRYYDECAETIDMYLTFWQLGIPDALAQAEGWWNWTNSNLWEIDGSTGTGYYKYALDWNTFECETGGFDQIICKLYNADPSITNVANLLTDLETRALSQGWGSPQWGNYVVIHAADNPQERLENTIMLWASLLAFYGNMNSTMQSQVQGLLDGSTGPAPAWNLLTQSELYDNSTGMFSLHSDSSDSVEATADATVLIMLLSTIPVSGSPAVPMEDCVYEDINNIIDGGISNINLTSNTVTISVSQPGTFLSTFGTNIFEYDLNSSGIWQLTFSSDWNSITDETLMSQLPTSRIYLGTNAINNLTISASNDIGSIITPSGSISVAPGGNQTFTYSADSGYTINQVLVDDQQVPITGTYTFIDVQVAHTISVTSSPAPTPAPSPLPTPTPTLLSIPTPTRSPSPTPTTAPTASPTLAATQTPPSTSPILSLASTPLLTPASTTRGSSLFSVPLPDILGGLIFLAVLLAVLILLPLVKRRRKPSDDAEKTIA